MGTPPSVGAAAGCTLSAHSVVALPEDSTLHPLPSVEAPQYATDVVLRRYAAPENFRNASIVFAEVANASIPREPLRAI